jgi:outer membrane protein assembly factor BamB
MTTRTLCRVLVAAVLAVPPARADDWPQWRGPDRSNVSREKGLLKEWPADGPKLAWKATGLGDGVTPVSVSGGRVLATGNVGGDVVCTAWSEKDGKPLWSTMIGPAAKESAIMRWLSQAAPTVDGDRVYAVTANGDYACLAADTGKIIWQKRAVEDLGGKRTGWGYCDYPLVDGDNLIVTPGGSKGVVTALDKKTGAVVWACPLPGGDAHGHCTLVAAEIAGTRQYINHLSRWMVGVSAKDGILHWKYDGMKTKIATTHGPVVRDDTVFYASGYGVGHVLLKVGKTDAGWTVTEVYRNVNNDYVPWLGSPTRVGEQAVLNTTRGMKSLDWKTGQTDWSENQLGRCTYTVADGMLYVRDQKGPIHLASASPKEFRTMSRFTPPRPDQAAPAWTYPVVANGSLYIRDYDTLLCYDVRDPDYRKKKVPDAVFVPTPHDVVARMLDLAKVTKDDVVYDLGSGDGRIVIAAAKATGCKAVGVEIDKDLVAAAREKAKTAGVDKLVTFEQGDLFEADFSKATVVALYLLPSMNEKLVPKLNKLKEGSRVVAHYFPIPGVTPDQTVELTSEEDDVKRKVYLYTVPLRLEKPGR